jgi:hypothetical protein
MARLLRKVSAKVSSDEPKKAGLVSRLFPTATPVSMHLQFYGASLPGKDKEHIPYYFNTYLPS